MMEDAEIIEKVKKYLENKEQLDAQSCYFITKKLNEMYWEEINEVEEEEYPEDEEDDLPMEDDDIEEEAEPEAEPEPKKSNFDMKKVKKKKPKKQIIARPKIHVAKDNYVED